MSDFQQPKSFRTPPIDIEVGAGDSKRTIKISDLPYGRRSELFQKLVSIWFGNETAPASASLLREQTIAIVESEKISVVDAIKKIQDQIIDLYGSNNTDNVIDLLVLCTSGQLDRDYIANEMGSDEAINLLVWLLNRNLEARKNLNASLRTILNPSDGNT